MTESLKAMPTGIRLMDLLGYGVSKLAPGLIYMVAIPVWIAHFGAAAYGVFAVTLAVASVVASLLVGWLRQALLRGTGRTDWPVRQVLGLRFSLGLTTAALVALVAASPVLSVDVRLAPIIYSGACLTVLTAVYTVLQAVVQRTGRAGIYALADCIRIGGALLLSLLFASSHAAAAVEPALLIVVATCVGYVVAALVCILALARTPSVPHGLQAEVKRRDVVGQMWVFGWPLSIWLALSSIQVYLDRFLISVYLDSHAVGAYAAQADLVGRGLAMVIFPITMAAHPIVMRYWNSGLRAEALAITRTWLIRTAGFLVCCNVLLLFAGTWLVGLLLPSIGDVSAALVLLLGVGASVWQLSQLAHKPLEFTDRTLTMVVLLAASIGVGMVMGALLVPAIGANGAALSSAIGGAVYLASSWWLGARQIQRLGVAPGVRDSHA